MRQRGFSAVVVILLLLILVGIGGAFYYLIQIKNKQSADSSNLKQPAEPRIENNQPASTISAIQEQQKKFQSSQHKFSLSYPVNWSYKENDPFVPNLAEYTVTFSSQDQNTVLDVWIKNGNWADVEKEMLKGKNAVRGTIAGQPSVAQSQGANDGVAFVKHPSITDKILVFSSIGENLSAVDQIKQTLKFE